jgi:signal transduction histidine kinase
VSTRPLDRVTSIRAKLGLTIVFAVAVTILVMYVLFGYALRNSARDSETLELLPIANAVASGRSPAVPDGVTVAAPGRSTQLPSSFQRSFFSTGVHTGVSGGYEFAAVPANDGSGIVYVLRPVPDRGPIAAAAATVRFLRSYWWQLLLGGAIAAGIALLLVRWLARGMTKPLRDMANASRRMARGDYTQRVETNSRDEVGALAEAFNRMSADLESLDRLRRELVANVSHELKTPISALRAHLENLLDGIEHPDPQVLQVMLQQSERLSRLVDQLLDLSRLESGDVPLEREVLPLPPLVDRVVSEIGVSRSERGVHVRNDLPPELPAVWGDAERVHQVLFNLLDNAVRFAPEGGEVVVSASRRNGSCTVAVRDDGPGIAAEHLPRLFERFYRVDTARSRDDGGTGIGLAIARSVVEAHGGRIWAESDPGTGSVFSFELPVAPADRGRYE